MLLKKDYNVAVLRLGISVMFASNDKHYFLINLQTLF
jgi:hypothetical protein